MEKVKQKGENGWTTFIKYRKQTDDFVITQRNLELLRITGEKYNYDRFVYVDMKLFKEILDKIKKLQEKKQ